MPDRELLVRIVGDDRDLQRALTNTDRRLESIDRRTQRFGRTVTGAFAAVGITVGLSETFRFMGAAVEQASALNEEIAKSEQVFGDSAKSIRDWAKTTSDSMGISEIAALQATGTFGNLFRTIGTAPRDAAAMSQALVQLAADLASFNNADPSDVLLAIRSGLIGEAEPLRRYGVLLSEARVQQEAMAASGKNTAKELTNQEKALARYEIILRDTATAQGDFARTQDSLANQTRILDANMADLTATIGGKLEPAVLHLAQTTNRVFDLFQEEHEIQLDASGAEAEILKIEARIETLGRGAVGLRAELQKTIDALRVIAAPRPDDRGGAQGIGAIVASNARVDAENEAKAAKEATRAQARAREAFEEFVKGLGLKLDRAGLTASLADDLSVLREIERAIQRRIQAEGRTFELVDRLTQVQLQIASAVGAAQADAADRETDAVERRLERQERADERRRKRLEQRQARRQRNQFRTLGLTATGDTPVPGAAALRRRLRNVRESVEGTILDTKQTEQQLDRIQKVLEGRFGKVGKGVREAILKMLNDISSALGGDGAKPGTKDGPLTNTSGLNTKKILEGLGLSEEEVRELRGRLSSINSAGQQLANIRGAAVPSSATAGFGGAQGAVQIDNFVTVEIDGQKITGTVTKQQQRAKKRNPKQKRGPNRGV